LNTTDVDAEKYIKIFTFLDKESIDTLIEGHKAPHLRALQRKLAEELTTLFTLQMNEKSIKASNILFGNATADDLKELKPLS
jgi:tyrosyl-tRNA synthetase